MSNIPQATYDYTIFIKVEPSSNPDCSWEGYSQSDNCNFLTEAANAVTNLGDGASWYPTIFTTAPIWNQFFGSSCDTFKADTGALISYANYDNTGNVVSTQSYADFVPFGGWIVSNREIMMKQVDGNVTLPLLCGNKAWHAFVD